MVYCLNPKKAHENRGSASIPAKLHAPAMALAESTAEKAPIAVDTQVSCQYCKYLLEGVLLGDCRVTRWIGSGAFGDVYEAEQLPPLHRRVAIKVMSIDQVLDGKAIELFAREVGAIAKLDHPNILPVMRVGMLEDGRSYLVMKYAAHGSLQNYCRVAPQGFSLLPTAIPAEAMDAPMASHHVDSEDTVAGDHQGRPYEHVDERAADQGDEVQDADTQVEGEQVEDNQTIEPVESELEKQNDPLQATCTPSCMGICKRLHLLYANLTRSFQLSWKTSSCAPSPKNQEIATRICSPSLMLIATHWRRRPARKRIQMVRCTLLESSRMQPPPKQWSRAKRI